MTKWQTSTPGDLICRLRNSSLFPLGPESSKNLDKKTTNNSHLFFGGISIVILFKKVKKKLSLAENVANKKRAALFPSSVNNWVCLNNWLQRQRPMHTKSRLKNQLTDD
jgi:hypothetical protein